MKSSSPSPLPALIDPAWKIGIVASQWHGDIVERMTDGARTCLIDAGIAPENVEVFSAPGSFEIPLIGAALAKANRVDAMLGFGIIVEGETHHARLLAESVAEGMMAIQTREMIPFAFEVLYVEHLDQAIARTQGKENKGIEAARSVLWSLDTLSKLRVASYELPVTK